MWKNKHKPSSSHSFLLSSSSFSAVIAFSCWSRDPHDSISVSITVLRNTSMSMQPKDCLILAKEFGSKIKCLRNCQVSIRQIDFRNRSSGNFMVNGNAVTDKHRTNDYAHILKPEDNFMKPINQTVIFLDCWRKPKYPEKAEHAQEEHANSTQKDTMPGIQTGDLLAARQGYYQSGVWSDVSFCVFVPATLLPYAQIVSLMSPSSLACLHKLNYNHVREKVGRERKRWRTENL